MEPLTFKYALYGKALPPRPVRVKNPGWGGESQKMVDGSEPQPWHCLPFVEGSTYGLELVYQYDTECQVLNDNGVIRFEWDFAAETGEKLTGGEFVSFFPKANSRFYLFNCAMDLQCPAGYVIRTEPHPRFFTDETGTAPIAMIGHVQTEWWPKKFFIVFKAPPPGQRHIFRKGEAYAQILFVPRKMDYEPTRMTGQEEAARRHLENGILTSSEHIARNVWRNSAGYAFSDHYKMLARTYDREGLAAVNAAVNEGVQRRIGKLPSDKPIARCLEIGLEYFRAEKYADARQIYVHILERDPTNSEAMCRLGIVAACTGLPMLALELITKAVAAQPRSAEYHSHLGELYRRLNRLPEAENALREARLLAPHDVNIASNLGLVLAQQGRGAEGLQLCQAAANAMPVPITQCRLATVLASQGALAQARQIWQAVLAIEPDNADAIAGLTQAKG